MSTNTLLVELGTEELPPKALRNLATAFRDNFKNHLDKANLEYSKIEWFATPRRLALKVYDLVSEQKDKTIQKKGPAINVAFKDNQPTAVALGWAKSNGIDLKDATTLSTEKGSWLVFNTVEKGHKIEELIPEFTTQSLSNLPIPKLMKWGSNTVYFVRPVHTLTMLYGDKLIDGTVLGIKSSNTIRGHRFMGEPELVIKNANDYPSILENSYVIADYEKRKSMIVDMIKNEAQKLNGQADMDDSLIEEVTSLVEYPSLLTAKFEEKFLKVPAEALVYTMKGDQKYFPVYRDGKLLPNFIFISNIKSKNPELVIAGNERVVRPRLSDAEFFFNTDRKTKLMDRFETLKNVVFQNQLGSLADKSEIVAKIAVKVASLIGADEENTKTASLLSKCDLMTNMVMEFTDTQGIMGMHYARLEGYPEDVCLAINEQYMPRYAGDNLPTNKVSYAVSIAEKIATLVGIFGINQIPKGDKDPFGLRRASIGLIRIIIEKALDIDIKDLIDLAISLYGNKLTNKNVQKDIIDYIFARFKAYYQEQNISADVVQSVLSTNVTNFYDFDQRIKAVNNFTSLDESADLAAANKRVKNILSKANSIASFNDKLLEQAEEIELYKALTKVTSEFNVFFDKKDYTNALKSIAILRTPIDNFFDKVIVNSENNDLKNNRLALLSMLKDLFTKIADISLLQK